MFATMRTIFWQAGEGVLRPDHPWQFFRWMPPQRSGRLVMRHSTSQFSSANTPTESKTRATSPIMAAPFAPHFWVMRTRVQYHGVAGPVEIV